MTNAAYERACITTMIGVCCGYFAFTVATQLPVSCATNDLARTGCQLGSPAPMEESRATFTAALIDTKGKPGLRGGDLRVDVVSARLHRPSEGVRFTRPQPATLGCGATGDPSPASNDWVHESPSVASD